MAIVPGTGTTHPEEPERPAGTVTSYDRDPKLTAREFEAAEEERESEAQQDTGAEDSSSDSDDAES